MTKKPEEVSVRLTDDELRGMLREATPGPWRAQADDDPCWSDGTVDVLKDLPEPELPADEQGGYRLASVCPVFPGEQVARRSDVHLIAAAPTLAAEVLRLRELVRRMATATEAHLHMHDLHCGDDYLPAVRRATRMPLDSLLTEARREGA